MAGTVLRRTSVAIAALALLAALGRASAHGAEGDPVVRVGDWTMTAEEIKAEFGWSPPALINQVRRSDNSARLLAVEWYSNALIAKAAADDKIFATMPGLDDAADALKRKMISSRILQKRMQEKFAPDERELRQFMDMNQQLCKAPPRFLPARIGVVVGKNASEAEVAGAQARMDDVKKRLVAGEDFGTLADQKSDLPAKDDGGSLGWMTLEEVQRTDGRDVLPTLDKGKTSDVLRTSEGLVLWKLLDRQSERQLTFEECRDTLTKVMNEKYRGEIAREWIDELGKRYNASLNMDAFVGAVRAVELPPDWVEREAAKQASGGPELP